MFRKIRMWQVLQQQVYMPGILNFRDHVGVVAEDDDDDDDDDLQDVAVHAYSIPLHLPSAIPANIRDACCIPGLPEKEIRLRYAQCDDALISLRKHLRIGATLFDHKMQHTSGTGNKPNTRMQTLLKNYKAKEESDKERYRQACKALLDLNPTGSYNDWKERFHELQDEDAHPPFRKTGESEGRRTLSWIWRTPIGQQDEDEVSEEEIENGKYIYFEFIIFHFLL